ncbi:hypothetical protein LCGC14_1870080 [marine sediment metagenome]|uniref:Uncharacterized protein n=1 Tax=marine sediment metagenome TaxID=412755 RepID=A0A0F9G572_9ZZZZ
MRIVTAAKGKRVEVVNDLGRVTDLPSSTLDFLMNLARALDK